MKNYEIRFKCERELFELTKKLRQQVAPELLLSYFKEKVFLLGLNQIQKEIFDKNPNIILKLFSGRKR